MKIGIKACHALEFDKLAYLAQTVFEPGDIGVTV